MNFGLAAAPLGAPSPTLGVMLVPRHRDQPGVLLAIAQHQGPFSMEKMCVLKNKHSSSPSNSWEFPGG